VGVSLLRGFHVITYSGTLGSVLDPASTRGEYFLFQLDDLAIPSFKTLR
jgi:hypothetical protein